MVDVYSNYYDVLKRIKLKRKELLELGSIYDLTNNQVVKCSQELDVLINLIQFNKAITRNRLECDDIELGEIN